MVTCTLLLDLLVRKIFKMAASIYNLLKFYCTSAYALAGSQLSARIAWGTTWDLRGFAINVSPGGANVVAGPALLILIMIAGCTSATTIRKF